jgi:hypothetical protein
LDFSRFFSIILSKKTLTTAPQYTEAFEKFDLLSIWQILIQVVTGRGSVSAYTLITRLLNLKQGTGTFAQFSKERLGTPRAVQRQVESDLWHVGVAQLRRPLRRAPYVQSRQRADRTVEQRQQRRSDSRQRSGGRVKY